MTQYGFLIDLGRCIGCHACEIACKQWNDIAPGPVKWLRVYQWEKGSFPDIELRVLPVMCFHCERPVCLEACPHGAVYKDEKYGAVLVDADKCRGERKCQAACPYGSPQFKADGRRSKMSKCDMCIDRLEKGDKPICVLSCSLRALEFGPVDELREKYGTLNQVEELPNGAITSPSVVFLPPTPKRNIVTWDYVKALQLWQKRNPDTGESLRDVFDDMANVVRQSEDIIGRNRLVLKAKDTGELMFRTMDDE